MYGAAHIFWRDAQNVCNSVPPQDLRDSHASRFYGTKRKQSTSDRRLKCLQKLLLNTGQASFDFSDFGDAASESICFDDRGKHTVTVTNKEILCGRVTQLRVIDEETTNHFYFEPTAG